MEVLNQDGEIEERVLTLTLLPGKPCPRRKAVMSCDRTKSLLKAYAQFLHRSKYGILRGLMDCLFVINYLELEVTIYADLIVRSGLGSNANHFRQVNNA